MSANISMLHSAYKESGRLRGGRPRRYADWLIAWRKLILVHGQPQLVLSDEIEGCFHVSETKIIWLGWTEAVLKQG
jgi:hypothetical protein